MFKPLYKEFVDFVDELNKKEFSKKGISLPPDSISLDAYDWFLKYCFKDAFIDDAMGVSPIPSIGKAVSLLGGIR